MIDALLPEPEYFRNPYYSTAAPVKKWRMEDVEKSEETETFKEYIKVRKKRKKSVEKAVATKYSKTVMMVENKIAHIKVTKIDDDVLTKTVIENKNDWYEYQYYLLDECKYHDQPRKADGADEGTLRRWKVNYIRHRLTNYDQTMFEGKGSVGFKNLQFDYRRAVMMKIAETYPYLREECEIQISAWEDCKKEEMFKKEFGQ